MKTTRLLKKRLLLAALAVAAPWAGAQTMSNLQLSSSSIHPGEAVSIAVDVDFSTANPPLCALEVHYGDGSSEQRRVEARELNNGRLILQHSYQNAGTYVLRVEGKTMFRGFKTAMACHGASLERTLTVGSTNKAAAQAEGRVKPRQPARKRAQTSRQEAEAAPPSRQRVEPIAPMPASKPEPAKKKPVIKPF